MKTEALEAVRKPPNGERQKLATCLSSWFEVGCGHCQCHLFWRGGVGAHYPEVPSPCLWMRKRARPPHVAGEDSGSETRFTWSARKKPGRESCVFLRFFFMFIKLWVTVQSSNV